MHSFLMLGDLQSLANLTKQVALGQVPQAFLPPTKHGSWCRMQLNNTVQAQDYSAKTGGIHIG